MFCFFYVWKTVTSVCFSYTLFGLPSNSLSWTPQTTFSNVSPPPKTLLKIQNSFQTPKTENSFQKLNQRHSRILYIVKSRSNSIRDNLRKKILVAWPYAWRPMTAQVRWYYMCASMLMCVQFVFYHNNHILESTIQHKTSCSCLSIRLLVHCFFKCI